MFNRYLPTSVYELLPRLHLSAAILVALLPLSPLRWVAVGALLLAAAVTVSRRRRYRSAYLRRPARPPLLGSSAQQTAGGRRRGFLCGS